MQSYEIKPIESVCAQKEMINHITLYVCELFFVILHVMYKPQHIELNYHGDVVVFDLDDTLYPERDYMLSGFKAVAEAVNISECRELQVASDGTLCPNTTPTDYQLKENASTAMIVKKMAEAFDIGKNAMDKLAEILNLCSEAKEQAIRNWVDIYRTHIPSITLPEDSRETLEKLSSMGIALALITDGRSVGQRNKLKALGLYKYFKESNIYISQERGHDKLSMEPFSYIVHRYPEARRFWYIGDNPSKDFISPNLMGWQTICLKNKGQNIHKQKVVPGAEYVPAMMIDALSEILTYKELCATRKLS